MRARQGYQSTHPNMKVHLPLRDAGIDRAGALKFSVRRKLVNPPITVGGPDQAVVFASTNKNRGVRLAEHHPERFEEAVAYEKTALNDGSPFTWTQGESLTELINPKRVEQIKLDYEQRRERLREAEGSTRYQRVPDILSMKHMGSTRPRVVVSFPPK